ncbi:MAG TPA: signal peptidase I [Candidatus Eremiobacteraceae bacterium]|nr:signal peptidase I [Candidatus Eremiobacteraceae bacterium]
MLPQPLDPAQPDEPHDARSFVLDDLDRRASTIRALRHAGALFVQVLVLASLVSLFFLRVPQVDGYSMLPQVDAGDHVLINTLSYDLRIQRPGAEGQALLDLALHPIERGDVIAFVHGTGDDSRIYLKRVIGLPGETVSIERGVVSIDGSIVAPDYEASRDAADMAPLNVPAGTYFVLGDNRGDSDDSRAFGPVPTAAIIGRAALVIWPPARVRAIR